MTRFASPASGPRRLGRGPQSHFFGYYNKSPWDASGRSLLAHRTPLQRGALTGDDVAEIGIFDLSGDGAFTPLDETRAWNWQMGAQLQWLGPRNRRIVFNTRCDAAPDPAFGAPYRAKILDLDTGEARLLSLPIYVAFPDGRGALAVNYRRLAHTHPTIGYFCGPTVETPPLCPDDDGIYRMDLDEDRFEPIISFRQLAHIEPRPSMADSVHWISHVEVNPSSTRFLFLHRWTRRVEDETCFLHRLFTCNVDGSDLRLLECSDHPLPQLEDSFDPSAVGLFDYEKSEHQISHPIWKDDDELIVWSPHDGTIGYHLYNDRDRTVRRIGPGVLDENGHMSYAPDGRWLLSDTYPDPGTGDRELFLWDDAARRKLRLGTFRTDPTLAKIDRCDLHPRWNRSGNQICIDSVHDGERAMYVIDMPSPAESRRHGLASADDIGANGGPAKVARRAASGRVRPGLPGATRKATATARRHTAPRRPPSGR
ncbi:hypothetical protein L1787_15025 [Acuticoccus sp. M5D2P5]|uniref:hypothetical protein n=1 Tax=Acuticoccus kalidii TaxID=2910977 RepID=UPI001F1714EB|nr:hypothetical protein [Acuticoccus kalidii]MCF3934713.1 hypothetical protein [Acuticoccus kalidii]